METKLQLRFSGKFRLQPILLASIAFLLTFSDSKNFISPKLTQQQLTSTLVKTPSQKVQILARVVHDVDDIKNR